MRHGRLLSRPHQSAALSLVCCFHISPSTIYSSYFATRVQTVLHQSCLNTLLCYAFQLPAFSVYLSIPSFQILRYQTSFPRFSPLSSSSLNTSRHVLPSRRTFFCLPMPLLQTLNRSMRRPWPTWPYSSRKDGSRGLRLRRP